MRKDKIFCVKCGKETDELIEGLCFDCYSKKGGFSRIKKSRIRIEACSICESVKYKGKWLKENLEDVMKRTVFDNLVLSDSISWDRPNINFRKKGKTLYEVFVKLGGKIEDKKVEEELKVEVLIEKVSCPTCSRKAGKYYEAIIQLRADGRELGRKEIEKMENFLKERLAEEQNVFISERKKVKGGIDIYISDKRFAHSLLHQLKDRFSGEVKESPKLFGMKDGVRQYRMTYLLRLPRYREGDIIVKDNEILYVERLSSKTVKVIDLRSWREQNFKLKELSNPKVLEREKFVKEAIVVSKRGRDMQILDPDSYKTVDVLLPREIDIDRVVKIVKYKDEFFVIPEV